MRNEADETAESTGPAVEGESVRWANEGWPTESWPHRSLLDPVGEVQGWRRVSAAAASEDAGVARRARRFGVVSLVLLFVLPAILVGIGLLWPLLG